MRARMISSSPQLPPAVCQGSPEEHLKEQEFVIQRMDVASTLTISELWELFYHLYSSSRISSFLHNAMGNQAWPFS